MKKDYCAPVFSSEDPLYFPSIYICYTFLGPFPVATLILALVETIMFLSAWVIH